MIVAWSHGSFLTLIIVFERIMSIKLIRYSRGGCYYYPSLMMIGMRLCATRSVSTPRPASVISSDPTPDFPLSGSTSFAIVLEKTEPSMTGYLLSINTEERSTEWTVSIELDTPGSVTNRQISIISETRNGFVQRHKVEIIGRIAASQQAARDASASV